MHTLNLCYEYCSKGWIELCHQNNIQLSVWTVDNLEMIQAYEQQDLYSVTTNRAIEYLNKRTLKKSIVSIR